MNNDPASLDRLHDIVVPSPVPWWPPAPGWYVVGAVVLVFVLVLFLRAYLSWRANAYRREALAALADARDPAAVGAILRRTALAETNRREVAELRGEAWVDWLDARSSSPASPTVREQLITGAYASAPIADIAALRVWAVQWIKSHQSPAPQRS